MIDQSQRTIDDHFVDWYERAFRFGYGSGEEFIIPALRHFFELVPRDNPYDDRELSAYMSPLVAWLLIDRLCALDVIEYGTSPRVGWLTEEGQALWRYFGANDADRLYELVTGRGHQVSCDPSFCNCGPEGYSEKKLCHNPFWKERPR